MTLSAATGSVGNSSEGVPHSNEEKNHHGDGDESNDDVVDSKHHTSNKHGDDAGMIPWFTSP